jgi:hypothetical protein
VNSRGQGCLLLVGLAERAEFLLQQILQQQLLLQPDRHRRQERAQSPRRIGQIGLQQSLELDQRLVVEDHMIQVRQRDAASVQTVADRIGRKARVVLLAREAFLLRGSQDLAVAHQAGGTVVVVCGDTEDMDGHRFVGGGCSGTALTPRRVYRSSIGLARLYVPEGFQVHLRMMSCDESYLFWSGWYSSFCCWKARVLSSTSWRSASRSVVMAILPALIVPHPQLGYHYQPNYSGHFKGTAYQDIPIEINPQGFRDRDFAAAARRWQARGGAWRFGGVRCWCQPGGSVHRMSRRRRSQCRGRGAANTLNLGVNSYTFGHYLTLAQQDFLGLSRMPC